MNNRFDLKISFMRFLISKNGFRISKKALIVFLLLLTASLFSQTQGGYYNLVYSKMGVIGSIEFNGMSILSESKGDDVSGQIDLNVWILPGVNKIKVKGLMKRKEDEVAPRIKAVLYLGQKGQFPDEGQKIAGYEWEEATGLKVKLPIEEVITFTPSEIPPSDLWKSAEVIQLNAEDKEKIQKLITDLFDGFQKKDEKKLLQLMEFRTKEFARARYISPDEEIKDLKKGVKSILKSVGGKLDKLELNDLQYQLIADNKVVSVFTKAGNSPIENKKIGFSIPLFLSKIQGEWVISR